MKDAQEQAVPTIGSSQKSILSSLQGLPSLPAASISSPLSVKLHTADETEELLLLTQSTKPRLLDEKFNLALNKLLRDEDEDNDAITRSGPNSPEHQRNGTSWPQRDTNEIKYNPFSTNSLLNSKRAPLEPSPEKSSENSRNVSVEIPDYSPDFNSESDMIGNVLRNGKDRSENDARYVKPNVICIPL